MYKNLFKDEKFCQNSIAQTLNLYLMSRNQVIFQKCLECVAQSFRTIIIVKVNSYKLCMYTYVYDGVVDIIVVHRLHFFRKI